MGGLYSVLGGHVEQLRRSRSLDPWHPVNRAEPNRRNPVAGLEQETKYTIHILALRRRHNPSYRLFLRSQVPLYVRGQDLGRPRVMGAVQKHFLLAARYL